MTRRRAEEGSARTRATTLAATALGLLVATTALSATACGHTRAGTPRSGPLSALPEQRRAARPTPLPEWYWEPVDADVRALAATVELPIPDASLVRIEGATRLWDELGEPTRERLRRDGALTTAPEPNMPERQIGAFYMYLREQRLPYVVTLDALSFAVHVAFERAMAEVDDAVLAPALRNLLTLLDARLTAEQKGVGTELAEGLRIARGLVVVAHALAGPTVTGAAAPVVAPDLAVVVRDELAKIDAHAGPQTSPLLGVPIDYAAFATPPRAGNSGAFRALTWLASAPLGLLGKSEGPGSVIDVNEARKNTRAAMVLARVTDREVDPQIHEAWKRVSRLLAFVWGPAEDLSLGELADLGAAADVAVGDPKQIANVVKVDRLRRRAAKIRTSQVFDGSGGSGAGGLSVRLLGGHASPDSIALAALTGAPAGRTTSEPAPPNARDGQRMLPSALDFAAVFGGSEARAALRESGLDAFPGYDALFTRVARDRPKTDAPARHSSVYDSRLDAVMEWLEAAESKTPIDSPARRRIAIESALAAWTLVRHDAEPLVRARPATAPAAKEIPISGAPLPAFVDPSPEVIARLVATTAQLKRGLLALTPLKADSSNALTIVAEVEDILRAAMRVATRQVNDEAFTPDDLSALASMPARLARLEDKTEKNDAECLSTVTCVADVQLDLGGDRVLASVSGTVEPMITALREPSTGRVVLAVGAHLTHHEVIEPRGHRRVQPRASADPRDRELSRNLARAAYTMTFRQAPKAGAAAPASPSTPGAGAAGAAAPTRPAPR